MNSRITALILLPKETKLLDSDVGGAAAGSYLPADLKRCDVETNVISALEDEGQAAAVLLLDARAWFSPSATEKLVARAREAGESFRVIMAEGEDSGRVAPTLALYVSSDRDRELLRSVRGSGRGGADGILDSVALAAVPAIDAAQLDSSEPALLLRSCADLARIERRVLIRRAMSAMAAGVRVRDPNSLYIRGELVCGRDVEIDANVVIEGEVSLGNAAKVGANCVLKASRIGERTIVHPFSLIEQARIGNGGFVGPYARIRPGSDIGDAVQIGNYVEVKNSQIGDGCRINHHSFIGDAVLGDHVTIGAGTITCNHDGARTNQTIIGRDAYVGSGCCLVAPLRIGEGATIGAGSTITRDAPPDQLTLSRPPQTTVEGWHRPKKT